MTRDGKDNYFIGSRSVLSFLGALEPTPVVESSSVTSLSDTVDEDSSNDVGEGDGRVPSRIYVKDDTDSGLGPSRDYKLLVRFQNGRLKLN